MYLEINMDDWNIGVGNSINSDEIGYYTSESFIQVSAQHKNHLLPSCYLKGGESEWGERTMVDEFLQPHMRVLEFGGGPGSVSAVIQGILNDPTQHVVIQPSEGGMFGGLKQLKANRKACNHDYKIIDHILREGEGPSISGNRPFDCIVVDCEGCLNEEYRKNPDLFKDAQLIIVERDDEGKYNDLPQTLDMEVIDYGKNMGCDGRCNTEVWKKKVHILHPVKTGGLAIRTAIGCGCGGPNKTESCIDTTSNGHFICHGHNTTCKDLPPGATYVVPVRNPVDRLTSLANYMGDANVKHPKSLGDYVNCENNKPNMLIHTETIGDDYETFRKQFCTEGECADLQKMDHRDYTHSGKTGLIPTSTIPLDEMQIWKRLES